jgi:hypothetical protein
MATMAIWFYWIRTWWLEWNVLANHHWIRLDILKTSEF